jgi:hypothetical protein
MKSFVALLVLAAVALAEPEADPQYLLYAADPHATAGLVTYANGAVTPVDTLSVQAAKAQHFAAKAAVTPYFGYPYAGAYRAHYIGKREAEPAADAQFFGYGYPGYYANEHTSLGLTAYSNGAVTPTKTLSVQAAEAQHFAAKAAVTPYGFGYPYAYGAYAGHLIGKREAEPEADAQFIGYPYAGPHTSIGLTAYPDGAVTPTKTLAVQQAEAAHFATKAAYAPYAYGYPGYYGAHLIGKRDAEAKPQFYGGYPYYGSYGYAGYGYSGYPYSGYSYYG